MKDTTTAFHWIVSLLQSHTIPFQVTGGFAAQIYGAERPLADIDLDVPENRFQDLLPDVRPYITYGPEQYKDESWDLYLLTLEYEGQEIDRG